MAKEYTIPELLGLMQIRGYSPQAAGALNTLMNTRDKIEYDTALETVTKEVTGYDNVKFYDEYESYGTNAFGLPIYRPLIFDGIPEIDNGADLVLESAIVEFNRSKEIVITKIQGREKSVKEHINDGDWQINVSGMMASMGIGYPTNQVEKYNAFMELNRPLSITHDVLNLMGITEIVITNVKYPSSTFNNAQVYGFSAIDDEPLIVNA